MQKRKLKRSTISGLKIILVISLLIFSVWCMVQSFSSNKTEGKNILTMKSKTNLDYQVYLKENEYFNLPYLNSGNLYITSMIDHIKLNLDYKFRADKKFDYHYQYRVVATLSSTKEEKNMKRIVWSKSYILKTNQQVEKKNSDSFELSDTITIPFSAYLEQIKKLTQNYKLDSNLDVSIYLDVLGKDSISSNEMIRLEAPMSQDTVMITTDYAKERTIPVTETKEIKKDENKFLFFFSCVAFGGAITVLTSSVLEFVNRSKDQFSYAKEKKKILNKYDSIIVNAKKLPSITKKEMIEVTSMEELIDAYEELHTPIIYIEIVPGSVSWFLIINNKQVWRYILRQETTKIIGTKSHEKKDYEKGCK